MSESMPSMSVKRADDAITTSRGAPYNCPGAPSQLRPWSPHSVCVHCAHRNRTDAPAMQPALKRVGGTFSCANKVVE